MEPLIFHIDVNSAYLSWTSTENVRTGTGPDLRLLPAIIGGDQKNRHGVVLAKSIPAKAFGIVTGEPVATAFKKCPTLQMAAPDHHLYHAYSQRLMTLLESFCPYLEQLSIDECFLDMGRRGYRREHAQALAEEIRAEVRKLGFTVNVGISSRKVLAKMASDFQKPDKTHTLFPEEIKEKMWPLPVGELYMAGHSSVTTLHMLGILTIGDLARSDRSLIESHLKSHGTLLWEYANGIDDRPVITEEPEAKGIGNSTTLAHRRHQPRGSQIHPAGPVPQCLRPPEKSRAAGGHRHGGDQIQQFPECVPPDLSAFPLQRGKSPLRGGLYAVRSAVGRRTHPSAGRPGNPSCPGRGVRPDEPV